MPDHLDVRLAGPADAAAVARLLYRFNTEFKTPTPAIEVLVERLRVLLASPDTYAVVAGPERDPIGVALVTLRTNVWFDGPVALLDELYVVPDQRGGGFGSRMVELMVSEARSRAVGLIEVNVDEPDVDALRFYLRHGFVQSEPGSSDRAFYIWREFDEC